MSYVRGRQGKRAQTNGGAWGRGKIRDGLKEQVTLEPRVRVRLRRLWKEGGDTAKVVFGLEPEG